MICVLATVHAVHQIRPLGTIWPCVISTPRYGSNRVPSKSVNTTLVSFSHETCNHTASIVTSPQAAQWKLLQAFGKCSLSGGQGDEGEVVVSVCVCVCVCVCIPLLHTVFKRLQPS